LTGAGGNHGVRRVFVAGVFDSQLHGQAGAAEDKKKSRKDND
jgi:hypothetical protein